ncbi:MAG: hypothetical protein HYR94_16900, partial [Chloroflexi bacterium]|nr:hypothetical protein [Chloroflexota bacterium]
MWNIVYKRFLIGLALLAGSLLLIVPSTLAGGWAVVTLDELPSKVVTGQPLKIGFMIRQHGHTPWVYDQVMVQAIHLPSREKIAVQAEAEGVKGHYVATLKFPQAGTWQWGIESGLMPAQQPMPDLVVLDASVKNATTQAPLANENTPSSDMSNTAPFSGPLGVGLVGAVGAMGALLFWWRTRTPLTLALLTVTAVIGVTGFGLAVNRSTLSMFKAESQRLESSPIQIASTASTELGRALFIAKGCIVCHRHDAVSDVRRRSR